MKGNLTKAKVTTSTVNELSSYLMTVIGSDYEDSCKSLLINYNCDLEKISNLHPMTLVREYGFTGRRAVQCLAVLKFATRSQNIETKISKIQSSSDAYKVLKTNLSNLEHEEFWILLLNQANSVIDKIKISSGGISGTVVDPRLIFNAAITAKASGIILSHNHPSGNLTPSKADIDITTKLKEGAKYLDIQILDHLIITKNSYISLTDHGYM